MRKLLLAALMTLVSTGALALEKACAAYLDQDVRKLRSEERINKYLLDRDGNVVKRFGSGVEPMSEELREAVEALL